MFIELLPLINKNKPLIEDFIYNHSKIKSGFYLKVNIDEKFNKNTFKDYLVISKRNSLKIDSDNDFRKIDTGSKHTLVDIYTPKSNSSSNELINYILPREFISRRLYRASNKTIDVGTKTILSTNYLTLFFNASSLPKKQEEALNKLINCACNKVLEIYRNLESVILKKLNLDKNIDAEQNIQSFIKCASLPERIEQINKVEQYIRENLNDICDFVSQLNVKVTKNVNIFFTSDMHLITDDIDAYKREAQLNFYRDVFNKNGISIENGRVFGNIDVGFNHNNNKHYIEPNGINLKYAKPLNINDANNYLLAFKFLNTLASNNNAKFAINYNLSQEEMKKFLENQSLKTDRRIKERSLERNQLVINMNIADGYIENIENNANIKIYQRQVKERNVLLKNYLYRNLPLKFYTDFVDSNEKSIEITTPTMQQLLSRAFYIRENSINRYSDYREYSIPNGAGGYGFKKYMENFFILYRSIINDFLCDFQFNTPAGRVVVDKLLPKVINTFVMYNKSDDDCRRNLRSLLNYYYNILKICKEGSKMIFDIEDLYERFINCIKGNSNTIRYNSPDEYYFIVGQVAYYLESQSEGAKTFDIMTRYLKQEKTKDLYKYIIARINNFGYSLSISSKVLRKAVLVVLSKQYEDTSINDYTIDFYRGICSENFIFRAFKELSAFSQKEVIKNEK